MGVQLVAEPTPRVNFELLQRYVNKRVLLVGQIDLVEGDKARVRAADGGMVCVELKDNDTAFETPYVEFTGIVVSPSTIREEGRTKFGTSFEMSTYNELCKLAASDYANIF